jgi:hypothetical protein
VDLNSKTIEAESINTVRTGLAGTVGDVGIEEGVSTSRFDNVKEPR